MPATDTTPVKSWLITFLIYDNAWYDKKHKGEPGYISLECQKNALYAAINALQLHEKVKIVFIEANINLPENVLEIWISSKTASAGSEAGLMLGVEATKFAMSNGDSLTEILKPVIKDNAADRNMLITLGHGSIFGINLYSEKDDTGSNSKIGDSFIELSSQKVKYRLPAGFLEKCERNKTLAGELLQKQLVDKINIRNQIKSLFNNKGNSENKNLEVYVPELNLTVLTVKEIQEAFEKVFPEKITDILVFDNCLMQNVFNQVELCETVNYLVASESGISYPGFNYAGIIKKISTDPDIDPSIIAADFVSEDTIRNHVEFPAFQKDIRERWCLNAVTLDKEKYKVLKNRFITFFHTLYTLISSEDKVIRNQVRNIIIKTDSQVFGYNKHSLPKVKIFDLQVFLAFFQKVVSENTILSPVHKTQLLVSANDLQVALLQIEVKSFIDKAEFYTPKDTYYIDKDNSNSIGFGFLLPVRPTGVELIDYVYRKKGDTVYTPEFLKNSDYFNFIDHLWKISPPKG